jgi:hypothetical protein
MITRSAYAGYRAGFYLVCNASRKDDDFGSYREKIFPPM